MITTKNKFLETLKDRANREKAMAKGMTMQSKEIKHPLVDILKRKAHVEGKELKPQPITNARLKALVERNKNKTTLKEE